MQLIVKEQTQMNNQKVICFVLCNLLYRVCYSTTTIIQEPCHLLVELVAINTWVRESVRHRTLQQQQAAAKISEGEA